MTQSKNYMMVNSQSKPCRLHQGETQYINIEHNYLQEEKNPGEQVNNMVLVCVFSLVTHIDVHLKKSSYLAGV